MGSERCFLGLAERQRRAKAGQEDAGTRGHGDRGGHTGPPLQGGLIVRTLQAQLQDIADFMAGVDVDPLPAANDFAEGAPRAAWNAIRSLTWNGDDAGFAQRCRAELEMALAGYPGGPAFYERILRIIPWTVERPFPSLAEIAGDLQPVSWLWQPWLPLGMITLLAAKPGTGKSMLGLDLARRIIAGEDWPDGSAQTRPGANVIYVDGENIPQVHNDRAVAWGLPRERLYLLLASEEDVLLDLSTAKYQEVLAQMVFRLEPALVVIDSLGAVLGRGENAVEDVRALLGYLSGLAQHQSCAILLVHHLRKSNGQLALFDAIDPDQIRGSGHITAMSRVAWGLTGVQTGPRPDPNGPRKLAVIKSNLARHPEPLGVVLEPLPDGENVRVVYDHDAPQAYQEPTERDAASEWLLGYLAEAGEPVNPKQVISDAKDAGFSRATIYRCREELKGDIVNSKGRKHPQNGWMLAETELNE
jgi:hypothetical protein